MPNTEAKSGGRLLLAAICITGAFALLLAALWMPGKSQPAEWLPLNEELETALEALDSDTPESKEEAGESRENVSLSEIQGGTGMVLESPGAKPEGRSAAIQKETVTEEKSAIGQRESDSETASAADRIVSELEERSAVAPAQDRSVEEVEAPGSDDRLDINRATAAELDALKGIGPAKAAAIVADRERNGNFKTAEDLLRVKGIGKKLLSGIQDSIVAKP